MKEDSLLSSELEYTNEPYAIAKIAGIKMCESYNLQYGTNFIAVMPTNLYGPNDNFDLEKSHVFPALIRKIHLGKCLADDNWKEIKADLNKNPIQGVNGSSSEKEILEILSKYGIEKGQIEIWGSGEPRREFLWSEDMADACVFLLENRDFEHAFSANKIEIRNTHINIGTGVDISIKELAEQIKNCIGYKGCFNFNTSKPDGTMKKLTDVSKLHQLGWKHQISLEKGVEKMYSWYLS
jgi:GDP-L-fucose synthase